MINNNNDQLIEVKSLRKFFPVKKGFFSRIHGYVKAVDDISFKISRKSTIGLVGESGCGKTTAGRTILRLLEPTSGEVMFENKPVFNLKGKELKSIRKEMQIIFQDPFSSLNPRMTIGSIISEGLLIHKTADRRTRIDKAKELLKIVGLSPDYYNRYPHEFSGGQRQRIGIARAIALNPKFIVCDEPVSALDVSVQAQIINLLKELQSEFAISYLFISHDLSVVRYMSDYVFIMYLGRIVEHGLCEEIFHNPLHPYTQALISAIPIPDPKTKRNRIILSGDVPSPVNPPPGCYFSPRCPKAIGECFKNYPPLEEKTKGHFCACLRVPVVSIDKKGLNDEKN